MGDHVLLGIDTGGTHTDAVIVSDHPEARVLAWAKTPTTHHDLALGIRSAIDAVVTGPLTSDRIGLVSISTTLATNAIVEGHGGRVCLITMGFTPSDLEREELHDALGDGPPISIDGGHTSHGEELAPLDLAALDGALTDVDPDELAGFAVVGQFAVRNRTHEEAVRALLRRRFDVPVTCSHELSARLNGPKRAVTSILNARLVGLIGELIEATRASLDAHEIDAPLMMVRGDGSLMSADLAAERPIETVLSGPAASVIGARHLTGASADEPDLQRAIVADIGGTTTDIAVIDDGAVRIRPEGARVGGHDTMVEAVEIHTFGLGGDSEVGIDDRGDATLLRLGPRRLIPVSVLATTHPEIVGPELAQQLADPARSHLAGSFAVLRRKSATTFRSEHERAILAKLTDGPVPLRHLLPTRRHEHSLDSLVRAGIVGRAGFTPTDAAHVVELHDHFDPDAARAAATLLARRKDRRGAPIAASADDLAHRTIEALQQQSTDAVLAVALWADGLGSTPTDHAILTAGLGHRRGHLEFDARLASPLVALGASAATYYPAVASRLGTAAVLPDHGAIANAIGAAVGTVRVQRSATVTRKKNGTFMADGRGFSDLDDAVASAVSDLDREVRALAERAGARDVELTTTRIDNTVSVGDDEIFVDAAIVVTASGRPSTIRQRPSGRTA